MTLRTRRIFFWALIPCFAVGGAAAVLYSQGYRIDAETRDVTKIGALFVRGYPRSATITLDGEAINTGSWWPLQNGTLDGSLAPGTYRLRAEAPGYRPWESDIVIRPALVTERKSLILFPEAAEPVPVPTGTVPVGIEAPDDFDDPVLLTSSEDPSAVVGDAVIPGTYLGAVNGRLALSSTVRRGRVVSQLLTLQAPDDAAATTVTLQGGIEELPVIQDDSVLHRESRGRIAAYDDATGRRTVFASSSDAVGAFLRTSSHDAWAVESATSSALLVRRRGTTGVSRIALPGIVSIQRAGSSLGVLDEAGSLWLVNPENGARQEIGHRATLASWKEDGTAVAAVIDGILEVIPLEKDAPHGKLVGLLASGTAVQSVRWFADGEHLFVVTRDELVFADVIDGAENEQHAYRMPLPQAWAYSPSEETLYVVDRNEAYRYVFPD